MHNVSLCAHVEAYLVFTVSQRTPNTCKMHPVVPITVIYAALFAHDAVHATRLSYKEYSRFANRHFEDEAEVIHTRASGNLYL